MRRKGRCGKKTARRRWMVRHGLRDRGCQHERSGGDLPDNEEKCSAEIERV